MACRAAQLQVLRWHTADAGRCRCQALGRVIAAPRFSWHTRSHQFVRRWVAEAGSKAVLRVRITAMWPLSEVDMPLAVPCVAAEAGAKLCCESANRWIDNIEALRVGYIFSCWALAGGFKSAAGAEASAAVGSMEPQRLRGSAVGCDGLAHSSSLPAPFCYRSPSQLFMVSPFHVASSPPAVLAEEAVRGHERPDRQPVQRGGWSDVIVSRSALGLQDVQG